MARPRLISDEQILTTMRACVLERGAQVSLDAVAEELGVTGPALLKRFGSRQELMLRALRPPENPPFIARLDAGPDDRPLRTQLTECFTEIWDFFSEALPCVAALRESGIPHEIIFNGNSHGPLTSLRAITRWLEAVHARGLARVSAPESVATAMLGAIQMRAFTSHITKVKWSSRSTREYLSDLVEFFDHALALPRAGKPPRPRSQVA